MIELKFDSIIELMTAFQTEEHCIEYLQKEIWIDGVVSPFDHKSKVYKCKDGRYKCKNTGKYFNIKTYTLFHNTKVDLRKWFLAIWLISSNKKGVSSLQLMRDIKVTQKTAWFMLHRIRNCFGVDNGKLDGEVEIDEAYVGGKNVNRHANKKTDYAKNGNEKAAIIGLVQRDGYVVAKHVANTKGKTLISFIRNNVKSTAKLYTDELVSYQVLSKWYHHRTISHSQYQYVQGTVHTNRIEGVWSILKRMIMGVYHSTSKKHLQLYVDEVTFRYNTRLRGEGERFKQFFQNIHNVTTYKGLTA